MAKSIIKVFLLTAQDMQVPALSGSLSLRNALTCFTVSGTGQSQTAVVFSGSIVTPVWLTIWPRHRNKALGTLDGSWCIKLLEHRPLELEQAEGGHELANPSSAGTAAPLTDLVGECDTFHDTKEHYR
ncbi:hypothetical protein SKAU_G00022750 [Synaphobranchus kaupii]|uniref:Uncharacterized protein n=1 Tax=Synaphobranchus kaupii TaxID=118154 RepID=A0A9Q1GE03_SYNKA|nr:hypothetical protein SKAU_G00022750 [Synaphobranchus kaupii]